MEYYDRKYAVDGHFVIRYSIKYCCNVHYIEIVYRSKNIQMYKRNSKKVCVVIMLVVLAMVPMVNIVRCDEDIYEY